MYSKLAKRRYRGVVGFQGDGNVGHSFCSASPRPAVRSAPCGPELSTVSPGFGLERFSMPRGEQLTFVFWANYPIGT